jgi:hypothetical protein
MGKKTAVPDAWDDDWESQADKADDAATAEAAEEQVEISKAERLAKHAESNKQLWESALVTNRSMKIEFLLIYALERHQNHSTSLRLETMYL